VFSLTILKLAVGLDLTYILLGHVYCG